ncbi:hypothetical protein Ahy_B04g071308 [Arachis hypogaea]|uniref:Uncharacterized protein n=1 Tax=Arachis hypogaea TaxID=3818 RepID=A0A444ZKG0_ARAHY|nr:hypothetical protein Ahy_B04g071308 [Arachis hypogaea]
MARVVRDKRSESSGYCSWKLEALREPMMPPYAALYSPGGVYTHPAILIVLVDNYVFDDMNSVDTGGSSDGSDANTVGANQTPRKRSCERTSATRSMFSLWAFLLRNKKAKFSCEKSSDEEEAAAERASEVNFADEISGINTGPPSPTSSINY